jgi:hypothetical protein
VSIWNERRTFYCSLDNIHEPCTTDKAVEAAAAAAAGGGGGGDARQSQKHILAFAWDRSSGQWREESGDALARINRFACERHDVLTENLDSAAWGDVFYGIEHLRKKDYEDGE